MQRWLAIALLTPLAGCQTPIEYVTLDWRLVDDPENLRIEIFYANITQESVCMYVGDWPGPTGKLDAWSDSAFLIVAGERFPVIHFSTGYCIGQGCELRVEPGGRISASIPYEDFKLPEQLRYQPKSLEFSPSAYVCG